MSVLQKPKPRSRARPIWAYPRRTAKRLPVSQGLKHDSPAPKRRGRPRGQASAPTASELQTSPSAKGQEGSDQHLAPGAGLQSKEELRPRRKRSPVECAALGHQGSTDTVTGVAAPQSDEARALRSAKALEAVEQPWRWPKPPKTRVTRPPSKRPRTSSSVALEGSALGRGLQPSSTPASRRFPRPAAATGPASAEPLQSPDSGRRSASEEAKPPRRGEPGPSALKRGTSGSRGRTICFAEESGAIAITDYCCMAEDLWYQGYVVQCDSCESPVVWGQEGSLQGADGRSRFAQHQALCNSCIADKMFSELGVWLVVALASGQSRENAKQPGTNVAQGPMETLLSTLSRLAPSQSGRSDQLATLLGREVEDPDVRSILLERAMHKVPGFLGAPPSDSPAPEERRSPGDERGDAPTPDGSSEASLSPAANGDKCEDDAVVSCPYGCGCRGEARLLSEHLKFCSKRGEHDDVAQNGRPA